MIPASNVLEMYWIRRKMIDFCILILIYAINKSKTATTVNFQILKLLRYEITVYLHESVDKLSFIKN